MELIQGFNKSCTMKNAIIWKYQKINLDILAAIEKQKLNKNTKKTQYRVE
jgi:uncharacterized protein with HEPN domain